LKYIKIIKQHQQNVNIKLLLQNQNDVLLKNGFDLNGKNKQLKILYQLKHEDHENQLL
jgi:hypothetical protein